MSLISAFLLLSPHPAAPRIGRTSSQTVTRTAPTTNEAEQRIERKPQHSQRPVFRPESQRPIKDMFDASYLRHERALLLLTDTPHGWMGGSSAGRRPPSRNGGSTVMQGSGISTAGHHTTPPFVVFQGGLRCGTSGQGERCGQTCGETR